MFVTHYPVDGQTQNIQLDCSNFEFLTVRF
jgi:hypothetical protein